MAYFAQLDDASIVLQVLAVNNDTIDNLPFPESEPIGVAFLQSIFGDTTVWKQTSYNSNFRKNYASIGFTYYATLDAFIPPPPFPYCVLDETTCKWICVKPAP
jgi:hypothetical protein